MRLGVGKGGCPGRGVGSGTGTDVGPSMELQWPGSERRHRTRSLWRREGMGRTREGVLGGRNMCKGPETGLGLSHGSWLVRGQIRFWGTLEQRAGL